MALESIWSFEFLRTRGEIADKRTIFGMDDYVSFGIRLKSKDFFAFFGEALVEFFVLNEDFFICGHMRFWRKGGFGFFK